jgi:putative addiction module killer protein
MIDVRRTLIFSKWLLRLRDMRAKATIALRLNRLAEGNPGDVRPVGEGVSEMRIDYGPGYRIYFVKRGQSLIVLLCGGDKATQSADISQAKQLAREWKDGS